MSKPVPGNPKIDQKVKAAAQTIRSITKNDLLNSTTQIVGSIESATQRLHQTAVSVSRTLAQKSAGGKLGSAQKTIKDLRTQLAQSQKTVRTQDVQIRTLTRKIGTAAQVKKAAPAVKKPTPKVARPAVTTPAPVATTTAPTQTATAN